MKGLDNEQDDDDEDKSDDSRSSEDLQTHLVDDDLDLIKDNLDVDHLEELGIKRNKVSFFYSIRFSPLELNFSCCC
jgi:hypothetical protein